MTDLLVGFVLDPAGYELDFLCVAPVVARRGDATLRVGAIDGWYPGDSREVSDDLREYLTLIDPAHHRPIEIGESVWALGSGAHRALVGISIESSTKRTIGGWPVSSRGFRWTIGSRTEFLDQSRSFANILTRHIKSELAKGASPEETRSQIEFFARLEGIDDLDRLVILGLIAQLDYDEARFAALATEFRHLFGWRSFGKGSLTRRVRRLRNELEERALRRSALGLQSQLLAASMVRSRFALPSDVAARVWVESAGVPGASPWTGFPGKIDRASGVARTNTRAPAVRREQLQEFEVPK